MSCTLPTFLGRVSPPTAICLQSVARPPPLAEIHLPIPPPCVQQVRFTVSTFALSTAIYSTTGASHDIHLSRTGISPFHDLSGCRRIVRSPPLSYGHPPLPPPFVWPQVRCTLSTSLGNISPFSSAMSPATSALHNLHLSDVHLPFPPLPGRLQVRSQTRTSPFHRHLSSYSSVARSLPLTYISLPNRHNPTTGTSPALYLPDTHLFFNR